MTGWKVRRRVRFRMTCDLRQGNRYLYAGADPIGLVDPSGLDWDPIGSAKIEVSVGPLAVSYGGDGEDAGFDASIGGPLKENSPYRLGNLVGISGTASTGRDDGGGIGVKTCFAVCFGADSDEGVSFGGGLAFGTSVEAD